MSNLGQIKSQFLARIAQNSSFGTVDFSPDEQTTLANEAVRFTAVRCEVPVDHTQITIQSGTSVYPLPTDILSIVVPYLADSNSTNQKVLNILTEKELNQMRPDWMDESNTGEPDTVMLLDRYNVFLSPTPNAASAGKLLILTYHYYPALLASDSDEPDLPGVFHDLLPIYMAASAYSSKLMNPAVGKALLEEYDAKYKIVSTPAIRQKEQTGFYWKNNWMLDDPDNDYGGVVVK